MCIVRTRVRRLIAFVLLYSSTVQGGGGGGKAKAKAVWKPKQDGGGFDSSIPLFFSALFRPFVLHTSFCVCCTQRGAKVECEGGPDRGGGQRRALTHHEFEACTHKGVPWGSYTRLPKYETSRRGGGEEGLADTICQLANGVLRNAVCKYEGRVGELGNWTFIFFVATSANLTSKKLKQCDLKKCLKKNWPL